MVCAAPWYGLSFAMSPAKRKPSELSLKHLKARSTNRAFMAFVNCRRYSTCSFRSPAFRLLPPLYSGEIQPATLFLFRVATTTLFLSKSKPQERLGWLVGWLPQGRGDEAGTRVGGRLSVQGRGLLLGNMGLISSFVAVVLETPKPTTQ